MYDVALSGYPGRHPELRDKPVATDDAGQSAPILLPGWLASIEWADGTPALLGLVSSALLRDMPGVRAIGSDWQPVAASVAADEAGEAVVLLLAARAIDASVIFRLRPVRPADALAAVEAAEVGTAAEWRTTGQVTMLPRQMRDKDAHWTSMFLADLRDHGDPGFSRFDAHTGAIAQWPYPVDDGEDVEFRSVEYEDEIGREYWVDARQRHIARQIGTVATIVSAVDQRPNRQPDVPYENGRPGVMAQLEIGPDTGALLRAAAAHRGLTPWAPTYTLPSREWQVLPDAGDDSPLRYRFDGLALRFRLATDADGSPRAALIVPHGRWLGSVASWGGALADWFEKRG